MGSSREGRDKKGAFETRGGGGCEERTRWRRGKFGLQMEGDGEGDEGDEWGTICALE